MVAMSMMSNYAQVLRRGSPCDFHAQRHGVATRHASTSIINTSRSGGDLPLVSEEDSLTEAGVDSYKAILNRNLHVERTIDVRIPIRAGRTSVS